MEGGRESCSRERETQSGGGGGGGGTAVDRVGW